MDAMLRRALREFLGLLRQLYTNLLGEDGETWGRELKKFLRKEPCWVKSVINLADFFKTRSGLWVSDEFQQCILAPALEGSDTVPASVGEGYDLPKSMTDAQILKKLGHKVFESPRAFLNTLARLIDEQWGGKEGDLLNNGCANIFYVRGVNEKGEPEVFAVSVRWHADYGKWHVRTWRLDGRTWNAGRRAFPSN